MNSALAGLVMLGAALAALPKGYPKCTSKDSRASAQKKWDRQNTFFEKLYDKADEIGKEEERYRAAERELFYEYFMTGVKEPPEHKVKLVAMKKKADDAKARRKAVYAVLDEMRVEDLKCVEIWDPQ